MDDNDNSVAKILLADAIRTQDQQRMRNEYNQKLNQQESENVERLAKIEKENKRKLAEAESDAESNQMLAYQWKKNHDEVLEAFLTRSYHNLYHQGVLYGTRFLLLDLAEELNIPQNIMIKISLLTTHKYMGGAINMPEGFDNYFISYNKLSKERDYAFLLTKEQWKTAYESRLYKTMRDARGEIAQYLLSQTEVSPFLQKTVVKLDNRFGNLDETKKMLEGILAEQKIEQDKRDQENRAIQEKIDQEKAEKENLLMWAKEEEEILSSNLVIHQGSSLDEAIVSKSKGRNYYWVHLLNHILNGGAGMSNLKVKNEGSFFSPNKTAFVDFSVPYPKDNYFPMYNFTIKHLVENKEVTGFSSVEKTENFFRLGKVPAGTKIEKLDFIIRVERQNAQGQKVEKKYIVTYMLKKPFVVG